MRQTGTPLPVSEFCWNWLGNAIQLGERSWESREKKQEVLEEHLLELTTWNET